MVIQPLNHVDDLSIRHGELTIIQNMWIWPLEICGFNFNDFMEIFHGIHNAKDGGISHDPAHKMRIEKRRFLFKPHYKLP